MDARRLAVRCLLEVERGGYSNLVFKQLAPQSGLPERELGFAAAVFYGTLERRITLDFLLSPWLKKGMAGLDAPVRAILRAGLFQILYLDSVPAAAAVNESVRLCRALKKSSACGLVNAVLRRASESGFAPLETISDETERLSVTYALCPELVELLTSQYGAQAREMMAALLQRPQPAARVNVLKNNRDSLLERLHREKIEAWAAPLEDAVLLSGRYLGASALADGSMRIQSLAAQAAALALDAEPGLAVLDLCAAPGGKTLTIAQTMRDRGEILALDLYENRLALIREQAAREGVHIVRTLCADAAAFRAKEKFDRVLCDLPCSGYGEIAAKPELRYKPPLEDNPLFELQSEILETGILHLKRGGRLVYSTCTFDRRGKRTAGRAFSEPSPGNPAGFCPHPGFAIAGQSGLFEDFTRTGRTGGLFHCGAGIQLSAAQSSCRCGKLRKNVLKCLRTPTSCL